MLTTTQSRALLRQLFGGSIMFEYTDKLTRSANPDLRRVSCKVDTNKCPDYADRIAELFRTSGVANLKVARHPDYSWLISVRMNAVLTK